MRLREKVTQLRFEGSSDDDDDDAVDDAWQPGISRDGSDADEAPVVERLTAAQAEHSSRTLTHVDLANALQRLVATTSAPRRVAPEELTQVRQPRSRAARAQLTCASGLGAWRRLYQPRAGAGRRWRRGSAGHAAPSWLGQ